MIFLAREARRLIWKELKRSQARLFFVGACLNPTAGFHFAGVTIV
jgi:hypothetical protein